MIYLSQRDTRWAADKLGSSSLTVGRFGCTTTGIAMLSDYFGACRTPKEIAHNSANYTKDGLIVWQNLKLPKMQFLIREYGEHGENIKRALKDPQRAVLLEVNKGAHWVVALRKTLLGDDYVILDPWTGKKATAKGTYHDITGAAYFGKR